MAAGQKEYDVAVLGGGAGGWKAGIYSSQFGQRTAVVERGKLGGICANEGCVPDASWLMDVQIDYESRWLKRWGVQGLEVYQGLDYGKAKRYSDRLARQMSGGVKASLEANNVDLLIGEAHFLNPNQIEVVSKEDRQVITAKNFIIASGSRPRPLEIPGSDSPGVIDYRGALAFKEPPKRVVVIGASRIGLDWIEIWKTAGSDTTLIDQENQLIPGQDPDVAEALEEYLTEKGVKCLTSSRVLGITQNSDGLTVDYEAAGYQHQISTDVVLEVARRVPNIEELNIEAVGVLTNERGIIVDEFMRTSAPDIFAVGDVAGFNLATHAKTQGKMVAEIIVGMGDGQGFNPRNIPETFGVNPGEVASIGLQESEVGADRKVGIYKFMGGLPGMFDGLVKVVADSSGEIVGVHMFGYNVIEQIHTAQEIMTFHARVDDMENLYMGRATSLAPFALACQSAIHGYRSDFPVNVPMAIHGPRPYPKGVEGPIPGRQS